MQTQRQSVLLSLTYQSHFYDLFALDVLQEKYEAKSVLFTKPGQRILSWIL